jgi:ABC-type bacteriocin/lantibiotic exporter with double-glycine peptidase domain
MTAATGCAHASLWKTAGKLPADTVVLPVKAQRQVDNRCGPNALAMALNATGDPIGESAIAAAILNPRVDATLSIDLLLFARQRGFPADFERGSAARLIELVSSGEAPILLLNLEPGAPWPLKGRPLWHYVVVYGFSRSRGLVLIQSGIGPKSMPLAMLDRLWKPGGFWLMHLGRPVSAATTVSTAIRQTP